jgi:glyoxylase-like metal-dependent hydrolase (beta-lactamase superfamily II)
LSATVTGSLLSTPGWCLGVRVSARCGRTLPSLAAILDPLDELGIAPGDATDIVLSRHHPDHTVNIALFGEIPVHDFQAVYQRDCWDAREADGKHLTSSVRLLATPGHTPRT